MRIWLVIFTFAVGFTGTSYAADAAPDRESCADASSPDTIVALPRLWPDLKAQGNRERRRDGKFPPEIQPFADRAYQDQLKNFFKSTQVQTPEAKREILARIFYSFPWLGSSFSSRSASHSIFSQLVLDDAHDWVASHQDPFPHPQKELAQRDKDEKLLFANVFAYTAKFFYALSKTPRGLVPIETDLSELTGEERRFYEERLKYFSMNTERAPIVTTEYIPPNLPPELRTLFESPTENIHLRGIFFSSLVVGPDKYAHLSLGVPGNLIYMGKSQNQIDAQIPPSKQNLRFDFSDYVINFDQVTNQGAPYPVDLLINKSNEQNGQQMQLFDAAQFPHPRMIPGVAAPITNFRMELKSPRENRQRIFKNVLAAPH